MIYFSIGNCFDDGIAFYYKNVKQKTVNAGTTSLVPVAFENVTIKQLLDNCSFQAMAGRVSRGIEHRGIVNSTSSNNVSFPANISYNASEKVADNTVYHIALMGYTESDFCFRAYYYNKTAINEAYDSDYAKGNHSFDKYKYSSYILVRDYTTYGSSSSNVSCCYDIRYGSNQLDVPYLCRGNLGSYSKYDLIKEISVKESNRNVTFKLYGVPNIAFGTKTVTWTTGALWWKKNHSATVTSYADISKCECPCFKTYTIGEYYPTNLLNLRSPKLKVRGSTMIGSYEDFHRFGFYTEPGYVYVVDTNFMATSTNATLNDNNFVNQDGHRPENHKDWYNEGFFYKTTFDRNLSPSEICTWAANNMTNKIKSELK